ncbi:hypothetical protein ACIPSA_23790 [Streptomyces sp. NPDC086549]|uniref:hypothetical protein n=1 Tax=Streptomyces sp. NPDC086549 TaxID=3365752 RepID=UPI00382ED7C8
MSARSGTGSIDDHDFPLPTFPDGCLCLGRPGDLVSTADDLSRFQQALFSGALLPPRATEKLFALPPDTVRMLDGSPARYSMGLQTATVNGVAFWGETGENYGYRARLFATRDLTTRFVLSYTPTPLNAAEEMTNRVVTVLTAA